MAYKWLATLALTAVLANGQVDIKGELKTCLQDGQDLNKCLRGLANSFKPYMKTGFPELGIPKAEPLFIEQIKFDLKNPLIDVNVDFTENFVSGLSTHELIYIRADKEKKTIAMKIFVPESVAKGLYVIEGKVAVLELDAQPPAAYKTEFKDTTIEGVAQLKVENNKLIIDGDPEMTIELGGLNIKMDNLFGGKADSLARTVDKFLNQNTDKFIKDFQPAIAKSVSGFMKGFYNSAVANIDLDSQFLFNMVRFLALVVSTAAVANAFAPVSVPSATAVSTTKLYGYVPAGLTEAQYKEKLAKEKATKEKNKIRFPKGKSFLGVGEWLDQMENKQTFKGENFRASGHTYAKQKFETKEDFDKAKAKK